MRYYSASHAGNAGQDRSRTCLVGFANGFENQLLYLILTAIYQISLCNWILVFWNANGENNIILLVNKRRC